MRLNALPELLLKGEHHDSEKDDSALIVFLYYARIQLKNKHFVY
jgi:hypothetical protein